MATNVLKMIPGEKRYYAVEFAAQQEIVNGETLTGTPTVAAVPATDLTIAAQANGSGAGQGVISGTQVRFWITSGAAAALGNRTVTVTVATSGGATIEEVCTLRLVASF